MTLDRRERPPRDNFRYLGASSILRPRVEHPLSTVARNPPHQTSAELAAWYAQCNSHGAGPIPWREDCSETQAHHLSRQSRGSGRAADSNAPGCAGTTDPDTTDAGTTNLDTTDSDTTDNNPGNDSRNDRNTAADGTARGSVRADQSGRRADRIERNHCNT